MKRTTTLLVRAIAAIGIGFGAVPCRALELSNAGFRLAVECEKDEVKITLDDKQSGLRIADGAYLYRATKEKNKKDVFLGLKGVSMKVDGPRLTIGGKLAGLDIQHTFDLPKDRPILEERIVVRNGTNERIALSSFQTGFVRPITDDSGKVLSELAGDRFVAVPLRHRADDPPGHVNDYSGNDIVAQAVAKTNPMRQRRSEGWAWTHGAWSLGIFHFCQENMVFSTLSVDGGQKQAQLRFGGANLIPGDPQDPGVAYPPQNTLLGEPAALQRIAPGDTIDLGVTRYETSSGGYIESMYAFRRMLDEKGCRYPKDFNPPVHWEQLYDMENAWYDRPNKYTKAIIEKEIEKAKAYRCEALYLDPGWDTAFGTFLWGEKWLGPEKEFIEELRTKHGLALSLHCPLATWATHKTISWGLDNIPTWPAGAKRMVSQQASRLWVPAARDGRRNLALLPAAKAKASSTIQGYSSHKQSHLNDGLYGNDASWVAAKMPAWAEIDLGDTYTISEVRLSNDRSGQHHDRAAKQFRILVATQYDADSHAPAWHEVSKYSGPGIQGEQVFRFAAIPARWVRVDVAKSEPLEVRFDELEIYEDQRSSEETLAAYKKDVRGRPKPVREPCPILCLGSKQYLDAAEKRLLDRCAAGAVYLMYDGNWWGGSCNDPAHGHPIPYRAEDHIRANLDLVQRIHAKYPKVLIELHDPLAGGCHLRPSPVYYKYGLPGSYDDNWGFELMWDPLKDLKDGRGYALYYYNLGCNIPAYLHIDLRKDTPGCPVLWWFASTCRHLGIGGTHNDPKVVAAQKEAMQKYRKLERFFKRGEFHGINEEVHLHALPQENAFVVNLFNLSDNKKTVGGSIELERMGIQGDRLESDSEGPGTLEKGVWTIQRELPPWSAEVYYVHTGQ